MRRLVAEAGPSGSKSLPDDFDFDAWAESMIAQMVANTQHQNPDLVRTNMASVVRR